MSDQSPDLPVLPGSDSLPVLPGSRPELESGGEIYDTRRRLELLYRELPDELDPVTAYTLAQQPVSDAEMLDGAVGAVNLSLVQQAAAEMAEAPREAQVAGWAQMSEARQRLYVAAGYEPPDVQEARKQEDKSLASKVFGFVTAPITHARDASWEGGGKALGWLMTANDAVAGHPWRAQNYMQGDEALARTQGLQHREAMARLEEESGQFIENDEADRFGARYFMENRWTYKMSGDWGLESIEGYNAFGAAGDKPIDGDDPRYQRYAEIMDELSADERYQVDWGQAWEETGRNRGEGYIPDSVQVEAQNLLGRRHTKEWEIALTLAQGGSFEDYVSDVEGLDVESVEGLDRVAALKQELLANDDFRAARDLMAAEESKVSLGRSFAEDILGLSEEDTLHAWTSGGVDALHVMTFDPTIAAGRGLKGLRMAKWAVADTEVSKLHRLARGAKALDEGTIAKRHGIALIEDLTDAHRAGLRGAASRKVVDDAFREVGLARKELFDADGLPTKFLADNIDQVDEAYRIAQERLMRSTSAVEKFSGGREIEAARDALRNVVQVEDRGGLRGVVDAYRRQQARAQYRATERIAQAFRDDDYWGLVRDMPHVIRGLNPMMDHHRLLQTLRGGKGITTADDVWDFYRSAEGWAALGGGKLTPTYLTNTLVELPRMTTGRQAARGLSVGVGDAIDWARMAGTQGGEVRNGVRYLATRPVRAAGKAFYYLSHQRPVSSVLPLTDEVEFRKVVEMGAMADVPPDVMAHTFNRFVAGLENADSLGRSASLATRQQVALSYMDDLFKRGGIYNNDKSAEWARNFLARAKSHRYGPNGLDVMRTPSGDVRVPLLPVSQWSNQIELPAFKELAANANRTDLFHRMLGGVNHSTVDGFMSAYWKPAMLLRLGFIPRAAGEEMLMLVSGWGADGIEAKLVSAATSGKRSVPGYLIDRIPRIVQDKWGRIPHARQMLADEVVDRTVAQQYAEALRQHSARRYLIDTAQEAGVVPNLADRVGVYANYWSARVSQMVKRAEFRMAQSRTQAAGLRLSLNEADDVFGLAEIYGRTVDNEALRRSSMRLFRNPLAQQAFGEHASGVGHWWNETPWKPDNVTEMRMASNAYDARTNPQFIEMRVTGEIEEIEVTGALPEEVLQKVSFGKQLEQDDPVFMAGAEVLSGRLPQDVIDSAAARLPSGVSLVDDGFWQYDVRPATADDLLALFDDMDVWRGLPVDRGNFSRLLREGGEWDSAVPDAVEGLADDAQAVHRGRITSEELVEELTTGIERMGAYLQVEALSDLDGDDIGQAVMNALGENPEAARLWEALDLGDYRYNPNLGRLDDLQPRPVDPAGLADENGVTNAAYADEVLDPWVQSHVFEPTGTTINDYDRGFHEITYDLGGDEQRVFFLVNADSNGEKRVVAHLTLSNPETGSSRLAALGDEPVDAMREWQIDYVMVHPEFRGQGVSEDLYNLAKRSGLDIEAINEAGMVTDFGRAATLRRMDNIDGPAEQLDPVPLGRPVEFGPNPEIDGLLDESVAEGAPVALEEFGLTRYGYAEIQYVMGQSDVAPVAMDQFPLADLSGVAFRSDAEGLVPGIIDVDLDAAAVQAARQADDGERITVYLVGGKYLADDPVRVAARIANGDQTMPVQILDLDAAQQARVGDYIAQSLNPDPADWRQGRELGQLSQEELMDEAMLNGIDPSLSPAELRRRLDMIGYQGRETFDDWMGGPAAMADMNLGLDWLLTEPSNSNRSLDALRQFQARFDALDDETDRLVRIAMQRRRKGGGSVAALADEFGDGAVNRLPDGLRRVLDERDITDGLSQLVAHMLRKPKYGPNDVAMIDALFQLDDDVAQAVMSRVPIQTYDAAATHGEIVAAVRAALDEPGNYRYVRDHRIAMNNIDTAAPTAIPPEDGMQSYYNVMVDGSVVANLREKITAHAQDLADLSPAARKMVTAQLAGLDPRTQQLLVDGLNATHKSAIHPLGTYATTEWDTINEVVEFYQRLNPEAIVKVGQKRVLDPSRWSDKGFARASVKPIESVKIRPDDEPLTEGALFEMNPGIIADARAIDDRMPMVRYNDQGLVDPNGQHIVMGERPETVLDAAAERIAKLVEYDLVTEGRPIHEFIEPMRHGHFDPDVLHSIKADRLPAHMIAPQKFVVKKNWFQEGVRKGFDHVIGPAISALVRRPRFIMSFAKGIESAAPLERMLRNQAIYDNGTRHLDTVGLRLDDLRTAWWNAAEHAGDPAILSKGSHGARAHNVRIFRSNIDDYLAYVDDPDLTRGFENLVALSDTELEAVRRMMVHDESVEMAVMQTAVGRAVTDTIPYIDDHNVRSFFSDYARNVAPFMFAQEQFLKRWARTLVHSPEAIQRAQLLIHGFLSSGFVHDGPYGSKQFTIPMSESLSNIMARTPVVNALWGGAANVPISVPLTGQVDQMLPGVPGDLNTLPALGPVAQLPLDALSAHFPEVDAVRRVYLGEQADWNKSVLQSIAPAWAYNIVKGVLDLPDAEATLNATTIGAIQMMEAEAIQADIDAEQARRAGNTAKAEEFEAKAARLRLSDNPNDAEVEAWIEDVRDFSRSLLVTRGIMGFFSPASPRPEFEGVELAEEYRQMLETMPIEEATATFLAAHPEGQPFTVFATHKDSGAPIPPTEAALDWMEANRDTLDAFPLAAPWLIPSDASGDEFSRRAYNAQLATGMRRRKAPQEWYMDMKFAAAAPDYFASRDDFNAAMLEAADDPERRAALQASWDEYANRFKNQNPLFARQLTGEARSRREETIDELIALAKSPEMPETEHSEEIIDVVLSYEEFRNEMALLKGDNRQAAKDRRAALKQSFADWGETYIVENPAAATLWRSLIEPAADLREDRVAQETLAQQEATR